jgi:hypothetical protein
MAKFLIEVPHEASKAACAQAIRVFLETGSHFLTHADWGCLDGVHKAWITVDVDSKEEARTILPAALRPQAEIVKLSEFSMEDVEEMERHHQG